MAIKSSGSLSLAEALVTGGFEIHARQRVMKTAVAEMDAEQLQSFIPNW